MSSQPNSGTERVKATIPADMNDEIEDLLDYGDSKSAWIRETIDMRLAGEFDTTTEE